MSYVPSLVAELMSNHKNNISFCNLFCILFGELTFPGMMGSLSSAMMG